MEKRKKDIFYDTKGGRIALYIQSAILIMLGAAVIVTTILSKKWLFLIVGISSIVTGVCFAIVCRRKAKELKQTVGEKGQQI